MEKNTSKKERRRKQRIGVEHLPEVLKKWILTINENTQVSVETIDASKEGICFLVPLPVNAITDFNVTLQPKDLSFKIEDEFIYLKPVDNNNTRMSVRFSKENNLDKYWELLNKSH